MIPVPSTPHPLLPHSLESRLSELIQLVPTHARILCLDEATREFLSARGAEAELAAENSAGRQDPRLLSPAMEDYDAICFGDQLVAYSLNDHQRMLALALRALRPARGILLTAYRGGEGGASENAFGSLLRQNGFAPVSASSVSADQAVRRILVRRV